MKIIIASSNAHKIKEIQAILPTHHIIAYTDLIPAFEIIEDATSFKGNAMIKATRVFEAIKQHDLHHQSLVLADDSGICIEALQGKPGIYSARYHEANNDSANLQKVIDELKALKVSTSKAYFCAAMALVGDNIAYTTHGFVHGQVITTPKGTQGFGYDPIFIPHHHTNTLSQMSAEEKNALSHRYQALKWIAIILKVFKYDTMATTH